MGMPNMHIDMHGTACHVNTAGDMQGHVSTHAADPKPPDLPIGSRRLRPDTTDGLESCPGTQRVCIYMQSIGDSSNRPENVLVTLVLPANGAEPCTGKPKRPRDLVSFPAVLGTSGRRFNFFYTDVPRTSGAVRRANPPCVTHLVARDL